MSQIELLQTKEQLQNKLLLLKSQVERALSERQFSEAAQVNVLLPRCAWLCAAAVRLDSVHVCSDCVLPLCALTVCCCRCVL